MEIGDLVVRKSYGRDITFKIIDVKKKENKVIYVLKGINLRIVADSPEMDLEYATKECISKNESVFNDKINRNIDSIMGSRDGNEQINISSKDIKTDIEKKTKIMQKNKSGMSFGRPGSVLHVDGDPDYLEICLKTYSQLKLTSYGFVLKENKQPDEILSLVKLYKPDIVVLTGHDAIIKGAQDYMDLTNYKNSKYYVESVTKLRTYNSNYDELVIFAGACQSCYEAILDAGANYASSPNRILIHCLDPVFLAEKIAYSNINKVVSVKDVLNNTVTGIGAIGGLQTRGKYREGYPKSKYI